MRLAGALALLLAGSLAALAQGTPPEPKRIATTAAKSKAKKPPPAVASAKSTYDAMSQTERVGIQSDLIWTADYNGVADGDFNERSIQGVKAFQERLGNKGTGVLNVQERAALAEDAAKRKDDAGWKIMDDKATGTRLGIPTKMVPQTGEAKPGDTKSRWQSSKGEVQIETFRVNPATLAAVYDQQRKQPANRQVDYNVLRENFFVISGLQGLKKFYVRAQVRNGDVRGVAVLYDQAMQGIMEPVVVAMSGAFTAFPSDAPAAAEGPPPKRTVDYGTGIVVSAAGHVLTDREVVDDCRFIIVPGYGHAERVADDKDTSLALIRLNGAQNLKPVAVAGDLARSSDVMLIGIADPERQNGGGAVSVVKAKLAGNGAGPARAVEPAPISGFSGAAAIEADQRFVGMVALKPQGAAVTDAIAIRQFLDAQRVKTEAGTTQDAKSSVVRVICVRR